MLILRILKLEQVRAWVIREFCHLISSDIQQHDSLLFWTFSGSPSLKDLRFSYECECRSKKKIQTKVVMPNRFLFLPKSLKVWQLGHVQYRFANLPQPRTWAEVCCLYFDYIGIAKSNSFTPVLVAYSQVITLKHPDLFVRFDQV